jgi:hypothetical protein
MSKALLEKIDKTQAKILEGQKEILKDKNKLSKFINEQQTWNRIIESILYKDEKTSNKGMLLDVKDHEDRLVDLETTVKVTAGKIFILSTIGGFIWALFKYFDSKL